MREITTKVYTFDELSEAIQNKIIESWDSVDNDWWRFIYEDAGRVGVKIEAYDTYRGTIQLKCDYPADTARKIIEEHGESCDTYILAREFLAKIDPLLAKLEKIEDLAYRRGSRECLDNLHSSIKDNVEDIEREFIYALGEEYLSILRQEFEYLNSREYISENILANNYEFTETGELV